MTTYLNPNTGKVETLDSWSASPTFGEDATGASYFPSTEAAAQAIQPFAGSIDPFRTPAEHWATLQTGMNPFWQERAPMQDLATRMMGRYYLGAPYEAKEDRPNPTFADYLSKYAGGGATAPAMANLEELRRRAREAAQAATFVGGPAAYVAASQDPAEFARRSSYASLFGQDAENQSANQLAVAQMLAMQQAGGDPYRGRMANAIRTALQGVQQRRTALGAPRESFLDWYLGKYHPTAKQQAAQYQATGPSPTAFSAYAEPTVDNIPSAYGAGATAANPSQAAINAADYRRFQQGPEVLGAQAGVIDDGVTPYQTTGTYWGTTGEDARPGYLTALELEKMARGGIN